jgi:tetratricopeptide (TPR) repeat protein
MLVTHRHRIALIVLLSWTRHANATEPEATTSASKGAEITSPSSSAESAFEKGLTAAEAGDWALALESFLESEKYEAAPGTTLNIARCREKLGQNAAALTDFKNVAAALPDGDERAVYARARVAALEPLVSYVKLSLPEEAGNAHVFFDGVEVASSVLGSAFPVDPGEHEVVVTAPGREREVVQLTLRAGEPHELLLEGGAPRPQPAAKPKVAKKNVLPQTEEEPQRATSTQRLIGFGALGLGAVSLAVSGITGALAIDRKNTMEANCHGSTCTPEGLEANDSGGRFATASTVTFGAGLALLGGGAALLYFDYGGVRVETRSQGDGAQLFVRGAL